MTEPNRLLADVIAALEVLDTPYMITGSVAGGMYGVLRTTFDVDIVFDPSELQLAEFVEAVSEKYYVSEAATTQALAQRGMFNVIDTTTGTKVDLILRKQRAFSATELNRRRRARLGDLEAYISSPEDVILSKLEWASHGESQRQISDARAVVLTERGQIDLEYLRFWATELGVRDALDGLIAETGPRND